MARPLVAGCVPGSALAHEWGVTITEGVCFHGHELAHRRLCGSATAVDLRSHGADDWSRPGARWGIQVFGQLTVYGEPGASPETNWVSQARHRHAGFAPPQWR